MGERPAQLPMYKHRCHWLPTGMRWLWSRKCTVVYRIDYLTRSLDCATKQRMRIPGQGMAVVK